MIAKTLQLTGAQLAGRALFFLFWLALGNLAGRDALGIFGQMVTLLGLMQVVATFGTDLWLSRHVANHQLTHRDFGLVLALKTVLGLTAVAALAMLIGLGVIGAVLQHHLTAFALICGALFLDNFSFTCNAILEGRRSLSRMAALTLLRWTTLGVVGLGLLLLQPTLMSAAIAFLAAAVVRAVASWFMTLNALTRKPGNPPLHLGDLLRGSGPMALMNFLVVIYFQIDMVMLPEISGETAAGWYKAAYSLLEALLFLSAGVASTLYPLFSSVSISFENKLTQLQLGMRLLALLAFPIAWGTNLIAGDLFALLFYQRPEEFAPSALTLSMLVWTLPAMFLNSSCVRFLIGIHRQNTVLKLTGATAALNIGLNAILIPTHHHLGAVVATFLSESLLLAGFWWTIHRAGGHISIVKTLLGPLTWGSVVWPAGWLGYQLHPLTAIPAAAVVYGLTLWFSGAVKKADLQHFGRGLN